MVINVFCISINSEYSILPVRLAMLCTHEKMHHPDAYYPTLKFHYLIFMIVLKAN